MMVKHNRYVQKAILAICFTLLLFQKAISCSESRDDLWLENAAAQIDFLIDRNAKKMEEGMPSEQWFIYFLGADVKQLEHILDQTDKMDGAYLAKLNNKIAAINSGEQILMYVAFTVYDAVELLTPLFPENCNTLSCQKNYVNSEFTGREEQKARDFTLFTENFKKTMGDLYESTGLGEASEKTDQKVLLPFSMRTVRKIFTKTGEKGTAKTYDTYTIYAPQKDDSFNYATFKTKYKEVGSIWGTTGVERKMEKMVRAIEAYYGDENIGDTLPCGELLYSQKYLDLKEKLGDNDSWVLAIEANPCILDQMVPAGDWWGFETQFDQDMMLFVGIFLYPAFALPAGALIGEAAFIELVKYLIREYGAKKVKDVVQAAATNILIQTSIQYYFGPNSITDENDIAKRWYLAAQSIDSDDLAKDVVVAALDLNLKADLILGCLNKGIELDFENIKDIGFNAQACGKELATMIISKLILDTAGGAGKKILEVFKNNPQKFIHGLREVIADAGSGAREAFIATSKEIKQVFDIKDGSLFEFKIKAEVDFGIQVDDYTNNQAISGTKKFTFSNTVKDVAAEVEFNILNGTNAVSKLGANITIKPVGFKDIRATLLKEMDDGTYRIAFVSKEEKTISSLNDFLKQATDNRKALLNALEDGRELQFEMVGANASQYFGKTDAIKVSGIEVYFKNTDGTLKNTSVYEADAPTRGSDQIKKIEELTTRLDDAAQRSGLKSDLEESDALLAKMSEKPELVDSWKALDNAGVDDVIRKNPVRLGEVDNYLKKNPGTEDAIKQGISDVGEYQDEFMNGIKNATDDLSGVNGRSALPDEISDAVTRIKQHRTDINKPHGKNYGYLEGDVNGSAVDNKIWSSGEAKPDVEPQIFDAIEVEGSSGHSWLRNTDSEYKMLNQLADDLGGVKGQTYPNVNGTLKIVSENPYCASCQGVIQQFNEMYPNINFILVDGVR